MTLKKREYTGGSVSYYRVKVDKPTSKDLPAYEAECNDIIKALKMNYAEGNAFKAIWRSCAARNLGLSKEGYKDGLYDAEKVVFFGSDMIEQARQEAKGLTLGEIGQPDTPKYRAVTFLRKYENNPRQPGWSWAVIIQGCSPVKVRISRKLNSILPSCNEMEKLDGYAVEIAYNSEGMLMLPEELEDGNASTNTHS